MHRKVALTAALLAMILTISPVAFAAGPKASGTIVVVAEGTADVKGADGKLYKI